MNNKKWIWIGMVVLFIMALMVGILSDVKKGDNAIRGGTDYVAVIRIDGAIVGGPRNDVLFGASGMTTSEQIMYEMEKARKDSRAKAVLIRINSPGGLTGATQEIAEEMDKIKSFLPLSFFPFSLHLVKLLPDAQGYDKYNLLFHSL